MSNVEKEEFVNIIKALEEEEKSVAIKFFPTDLLWEELKRRELLERNTVKRVKEALLFKEEET